MERLVNAARKRMPDIFEEQSLPLNLFLVCMFFYIFVFGNPMFESAKWVSLAVCLLLAFHAFLLFHYNKIYGQPKKTALQIKFDKHLKVSIALSAFMLLFTFGTKHAIASTLPVVILLIVEVMKSIFGYRSVLDKSTNQAKDNS